MPLWSVALHYDLSSCFSFGLLDLFVALGWKIERGQQIIINTHPIVYLQVGRPHKQTSSASLAQGASPSSVQKKQKVAQ